MSEKLSSPVTSIQRPEQPMCRGTSSLDSPSAMQGIRLSTVRPGLNWESIDLPIGSYLLGSRLDADVVIDAPGVAEQHCTLIVGAQRNVIKAWTNRTWINDGAVSEGSLRPGDRLILGPIELRVSALAAQVPGSGMHFQATPANPLTPQPSSRNRLSEEDFRQLLASSSSESPIAAPVEQENTARAEACLQELRREIEGSLEDVLRREHENREEFSRQRLLLSHRSQELNSQWQEIEQTRAKLQQQATLAAEAHTSDELEELRRELEAQQLQLAERQQELAGRSHHLVAIHRRLKAQEKLLQEKQSNLSSAAAHEQTASIRSLLARSEAQSRQLAQRQKELEQREESAHQQFAEIAAGRMQLLEQTRQFEGEQRQWQGKCKNREKFFDEFEISLTARMQEIEEEEARQEARIREFEQRAQNLDHRQQEIQLQQQGVDQATQLLEQQQVQLAKDNAELVDLRQQWETRQSSLEAELQSGRDALSLEQQQLAEKSQEFQSRIDESHLQLQHQTAQQDALTIQQAELDALRQELEAERQRLQIEVSEQAAEQQNVQRLRSEMEAERQRDQYEREQLQQTRMLLDRSRQELDQQQSEIATAREELDRQRDELQFQLDSETPAINFEEQHAVDADLHEESRREIENQREQLEEERTRLHEDRSRLLEERDALECRQNQIESARDQLTAEQEQLQGLRKDIEESRRELTIGQHELTKDRDQLQVEKQEFQSQLEEQRLQQLQEEEQQHEQEQVRELDEESVIRSETEAAEETAASSLSAFPLFLPVDKSPSDPEPQAFVGEPQASESSEGELDAEADAALRLRQQLANLFGMQPNSEEEDAESSAHVELPRPEARASAPQVRGNPSQARETSFSKSKDNDSSGSARVATVESRPATVQEAHLAPPPATAKEGGEDDSIAVYMERLLARSRQAAAQLNNATVAESSPSPAPVIQLPPPQRSGDSKEFENESVPAASRKPRKMDEDQKKSIRHNFHSFREVANQSARTAVAKSDKTRKSSSLKNMIVLNIVGWIVALALFIAERWLSYSLGTDALIVAGISFCLSLLCLYRYKELRKLSSRAHSSGHEKTDRSGGQTGSTGTESPEEKSGPLSFL